MAVVGPNKRRRRTIVKTGRRIRSQMRHKKETQTQTAAELEAGKGNSGADLVALSGRCQSGAATCCPSVLLANRKNCT